MSFRTDPSPRRGRAMSAVSFIAVLAAGASLRADDLPPIPLPPADSVEAVVLRITDECAIVLRTSADERTVALLDVAAPAQDPARRRLRLFLEQLLIGESTLFAPLLSASPEAERCADANAPVPGDLYRLPDGLYVNLEVIRRGAAAVCEKTAGPRLALLGHFERIARDRRKGIWSPAAEVESAPPSPTADEKIPPSVKTGPAQPPPKSRPGAQSVSGDTPDAAKADLAKITVWITKSGTKYHRADCRHLRKSGQALSLKDALEKGYEPCKSCKPPTRDKPSPP